MAITANDVAFTISRVQNPDTRSPLAANWNGVKTEVVDDHTVRFVLPGTFTQFLANTTLGILPKHSLENVKPSNLRLFEFNQRPIGSGPYQLDLLEVDKNVINLKANDKYYFGAPYISQLQFYLYDNFSDMLDGMVRRQIDGMGEISANKTTTVSKIENTTIHELSLPAYVGAFFNLRNSVLQNINSRMALAYATNRDQIIEQAVNGEASRAYSPILAGFAGFNASTEHYNTDIDKAKELIAKSPLANQTDKLRLVTLNSEEYEKTAQLLAEQWGKIGVKVEVITAEPVDLQQNYIRSRNYDILLYGQSLGLDSDVYSYWHSSQINDPGLNVSNYKSAEADKYLESGRIAKDSDYKASRYNNFADVWSRDLPAVILYTPYYNYAQSDIVHGFDAKKIAEPSNRFYNIQDWFVKTKTK